MTDLQEEELTFLQKIEEILSEKQLGENELPCMFRQNAQRPNPWTLKQTQNGDLLWIQILVLGVIKAQRKKQSCLPLGSIPPAPEDCFFSQLNRKEEASASSCNSPSAPHAASSFLGSPIPDNMVDVLDTFSE